MTLQMGQSGTDEEQLSSLFARQLAFASTNGHAATSIPVQTAPSQSQDQQQQPIKYSITQHYHHSAHLVPLLQPATGSQPQTSKEMQTDEMAANIILSRNGIDPSALFPSQLTLFRQADVEQQMRLIELWRISSTQGLGRQAYNLEFQQSSTPREFQVEDGSRPGQSSQQQQQRQDANMTMNGSAENDRMDEMDMTDASRPSSLAAEPYMVSGYEHLVRRDYTQQVQTQPGPNLSHFGSAVGQVPHTGFNHATDPVYQHRGPGRDPQSGAWQGPVANQGVLDLLAGTQLEQGSTFRAPPSINPFNHNLQGATDQADEEMVL